MDVAEVNKDLPEWMTQTKKNNDRFNPMSANPLPFNVGNKHIVPIPTVGGLNIDKYLIALISEEPFYSRMSQRIPKIMTESLPTACVTYFDDEFQMLINPKFIQPYDDAGKKGPIIGLLKHEFSHVFLGHLTTRKLEGNIYPNLSNIAQDLAINSLQVHDARGELPSSPWLPGLRPGMPMDPVFNCPDPKMMFHLVFNEPSPVELAVMNAPHLQTSEFYYAMLKPLWTFVEEGTDWGAETDEHDISDGPMDRATRQVAEDRLRKIVKDAAEHADNKGWGSVSSSMQKAIREFIAPTRDWREELKEWVGTNFAADDKSSTWTRINRRYPGIAPGKRRTRGIHIALCVDQSGSVSDSLLHSLFSEANGMTDVATITVIPFDSVVHESQIKTFDRGESLDVKRVAQGGTDFEAPTKYINSDKARDLFDVAWFLTDGECYKPSESRIPRCWLIAPGAKLGFETTERVITMAKVEKSHL